MYETNVYSAELQGLASVLSNRQVALLVAVLGYPEQSVDTYISKASKFLKFLDEE